MAAPKVVSGLGTLALAVGVGVAVLSPLPDHTVSGGRDLFDVVPERASDDEIPSDGDEPVGTDSSVPSSEPLDPDDGTRIVPESVPPRGTLIEPQTPVVAPEESPFVPLDLVDGQPVRWDPCVPITFAVRRQAGPPNGFELVIEGLQRVADVTGLSFQFEGFTTEVPDGLSGERAAPEADVWIGWAFDDEIPELGPATDDVHTIGVASPRYTTASPEILTGTVVLRADGVLDHAFGPGLSYGNILLHELGHLVGLEHSESMSDIMFPSLSSGSPDGWGPGDLAGLYSVGSSQPCF